MYSVVFSSPTFSTRFELGTGPEKSQRQTYVSTVPPSVIPTEGVVVIEQGRHSIQQTAYRVRTTDPWIQLMPKELPYVVLVRLDVADLNEPSQRARQVVLCVDLERRSARDKILTV